MGHPSFRRLSVIRNALQIGEMKQEELLDCSICHMSKQRRLPFQSNNLIHENAFDLVHIDIWGHFISITVEGYRYFLTIVDDHSRFTWVYLLKNKSVVTTVFPDFCQMILTQFETKIKSVRADNAHELNFSDYFRKEG